MTGEQEREKTKLMNEQMTLEPLASWYDDTEQVGSKADSMVNTLWQHPVEYLKVHVTMYKNR